MREAERAVAMQGIEADSYSGAYNEEVLARIYIMAGQPEKALDHIERLLKVPYFLSTDWLDDRPTLWAAQGEPALRGVGAYHAMTGRRSTLLASRDLKDGRHGAGAALCAALAAALCAAMAAPPASAQSTAIDHPATAVAPVADTAMAASVRREFVHAWRGYKRYAWGHDELLPLTRSYHDWYGVSLHMSRSMASTRCCSWASTRSRQAQQDIDKHLSFDQDIYVKNFEITIRCLGGLAQ